MTLELIGKASVILAIAAVVQTALGRRASAEIRHMVWTMATVALLLLPALTIALPKWRIAADRAAVTVVAQTPTVLAAADSSAPSSREQAAATGTPADLKVCATSVSCLPTAVVQTFRSADWRVVAGPIYIAGMVVVGIFFAIQWQRARRVTRRAATVTESEWTGLLDACARRIGVDRPVRLLRDRERSMPMTVGAWRAAIVIPASAETWTDDRRRAVILHELAHVARHDCLTQMLAFAACTVYWFHPAMWWVARRLRIERELACDDRVIAAGTEPREYAGHLLDIAYAFGQDRAPALAVSMAGPRQLESRMLAALDGTRSRRVPAVRLRMAAATLAAVLLVPLSVLTNDAAAAPQTPKDDPPARTEARLVDWNLIESARALLRRAAVSFGVSQDRLPGTWEIRPTKTEGIVHLRMVEVNSSSGNNVPIQQLEGLTAAQLTGTGGPVQFRVRRDAGTFTFEGVVRNGVGAGTFSFAPDANFPNELAKRGFARPSALEQYQMARHDIGYAFVDELGKQGYGKPAIAEVVRAGQHGVHTTYLREMGALGYRLGQLDPLITLRDHGVTPDYVRALADLGYKGLPADALRKARDHGVTPDYVGALRQLGHTLAMEDLIRARDHGVDQAYVRGMRDAGYGSLGIDQLIKARDHGVDVEYVRGIAALGYDKVPIDDLISLRDHGVTPDRIRAANARAGSRLPLDTIKRLLRGE